MGELSTLHLKRAADESLILKREDAEFGTDGPSGHADIETRPLVIHAESETTSYRKLISLSC